MICKRLLFFILFCCTALHSFAQGDARASARIDANQVVVGDQVRLFLEAQNNPRLSTLQWAAIPDSFNHLEVVEKGRIDTIKQGDIVLYKQRILITGFDSGAFRIPPFTFSVLPAAGGNATLLTTDSFMLVVQTVAVDTTKPFKPIKGIIEVKGSWLDYIWYILGGLLFLVLVIIVTIYFVRNKKTQAPPAPKGPVETLQQKTLRLLRELEGQQLWQKGHVKEYYVHLTDIVRTYVEERFQTPALEITTDELLYKARLHKELQPHQQLLAAILNTADLAKFAKAEPTPMEHTAAMENAIQFINTSQPVITPSTPAQP